MLKGSGPDGPERTLAYRLAYMGSGLHGSQLQPELPTVQGELERVLGRFLKRPTRVRMAGRTDAGVHATGQVVAFEVPNPIPVPALRELANAKLGGAIALGTGWEAAPGFEPRYRATSRRYTYLLETRGAPPDPFRAGLVGFPGRPLDPARLVGAAELLRGTHDFTAFCAKPASEPRRVRSLTGLAWEPRGDLLVLRVEAPAFLRGMVRNLVAALTRVAAGERELPYLRELLELGAAGEKDGTLAPAAPGGLYLSGVDYPAGLPGPEVFPAGADEERIPWLDPGDHMGA